jgi:hypothetical protein
MIPSTASRVSFSPRSTETAALTLDVLTIAAALCSCVRAVDPHAHGFRVSPGASASRIAPQSEHWIATGIASQPHTGERRGVQARAKFRERAADTKGGMKVAEERELVGTREAAALLGLSYSCFWRLTHEGWLPSFKMSPLRNARRYVRRSHIEVLRSGGYEALQEHLHAERAASAAETNGGARSDNRVDENLCDRCRWGRAQPPVRGNRQPAADARSRALAGIEACGRRSRPALVGRVRDRRLADAPQRRRRRPRSGRFSVVTSVRHRGRVRSRRGRAGGRAAAALGWVCTVRGSSRKVDRAAAALTSFSAAARRRGSSS